MSDAAPIASGPRPDAWPERGYAYELTRIVRDFSDAPDVFGLYAGINVVGAAAGRVFSVPFGMDFIRGNTWVCLVADSTTSRKSTVIRLAVRALRELAAQKIGARCTPEALVDELVEHPQRLIVVDELSGLLAALGRDYNASLREELTTLYGGDTLSVRTKSQGAKKVEGAHLSMLAGSNAAWLSDFVKAKDLRGGFAARWALVRAKSDRYLAFPKELPLDRWGRLKAEMQRILDMGRAAPKVLRWSDGARSLYERGRPRIERGDTGSAELSAVRGRLADAALKFAVAVQVDEGNGGDELTELSMRRGLCLAEFSLRSWQGFLADDLAEDPHARDCKRAVDMLRASAGRRMNQRDIQRATKWDGKRLENVAGTLEGSGQLQRTPGQRRVCVWELVES